MKSQELQRIHIRLYTNNFGIVDKYIWVVDTSNIISLFDVEDSIYPRIEYLISGYILID